jgi:tryptophan synthase alpha chain
MIESYIRERRVKKDILLMTHIVIGYPSLETSLRTVETMVRTGVDLMELQVPFSEPIADGPVILRANQVALSQGTMVEDCFNFAEKVVKSFDIPFLLMTYYNIPFVYGIADFVANMGKKKCRGAIIPDLPPEEGEEYLAAMEKEGLDPILIFSPTTSLRRMNYLGSTGRGFIYCVARKGVTGQETTFSEDMDRYLRQCRGATNLPIAVGFGVKEKKDIDFLNGKADIAVIGSQTIRILEEGGPTKVGEFIQSLNVT